MDADRCGTSFLGIRHSKLGKEELSKASERNCVDACHFDHVSAALELSDEWDVPIYAHPLEFPYLTGEKEYPAPNWKAGGGMMTLLSPTLPKKPVNLGNRLHPLPSEGSELSLVEMPEWTLLHSPGHTPGHVSFFRERDRTLLVETRSARPSRRASLKRLWPRIPNCMGRRVTLPRIGQRRRLRCGSWQRSCR